MNLLKRILGNNKKVNVFKNINSELAITRVMAVNTRGDENGNHFILDNSIEISKKLNKWT
jgi:hypothetical protein